METKQNKSAYFQKQYTNENIVKIDFLKSNMNNSRVFFNDYTKKGFFLSKKHFSYFDFLGFLEYLISLLVIVV